MSVISFKPKILTAAKVGIDSKKEIFAESYLLKFNNLEEEIVMPEEIQKISATKIRAKMREDGELK